MTNTLVKTRFAPSPSGLLHAGNLRTALFNYLLAHHEQGRFVLRIEDSDAARSQQTAIDALQTDLQWLGLNWDEGPGESVPASAWQQSARLDEYQAKADQLVADGHAYYCFCTTERLNALRDRQRRAGQPPRYDGCCAEIAPSDAAARRAAGEAAVLRFRMPQKGDLSFHDLVRGPQSVRAETLGDPIIQRADGSAAFLFANAVDDALMAITHVLRGEDHLTNTPIQRALLEALGAPVPAYGHLALVVDEHGAPLSKRSGAGAIADLRAAGYRPEAVVNYLARLGNAAPEEGLLSHAGLAASFAPERLSRSPARFEIRQLDYWQEQAMAAVPSAELAEEFSGAQVPADDRAAFIALLQPNIRFVHELDDWAVRLFRQQPGPECVDDAPIIAAGPEFFNTIQAVLEQDDCRDWKQLRPTLETAVDARGGALMKPLRLALTGLGHGPALGDVIALMPAAIWRERLQRAAERAASAAQGDHA